MMAAWRVTAQTTVTVPSDANIYSAGFTTAPGPAGGGGGVLATEYVVTTGTQSLVFNPVTGSVSYNASTGPFNGADGGTGFGALTQLSSYNSLSGITYSGRTAFLVGVFLDGSVPSGTAPATLSYNDTTAGASAFAPALRQVFFVGNGLDSSGTAQTFSVPTSATRLFLGFADAWNGSSVTGVPGFYGDNGGSLSVTINAFAVPEPSVTWLLGLGLAALLFVRAKKQSRRG